MFFCFTGVVVFDRPSLSLVNNSILRKRAFLPFFHITTSIIHVVFPYVDHLRPFHDVGLALDFDLFGWYILEELQ